ncbi:OsmC family peroxiredoxin [Paracrocinitomix mangrovi]|uniref:OsmC family protein n=1 Tax=Paracrocinitomix mangrovi TaxID=2862509 RepID=UPI001C8ECD77|nr:OsmC family protein [Paracrocinitomix mangrovi]UKN01093.1 OsmC family peroxiredoxin [Paracrocinitomix mangrovi]
MEFTLKAVANATEKGTVQVGKNQIEFGITSDSELPSPADLLVSAFAACCLKNVERFSEFLHYQYEYAEISVNAIRAEKPPMIESISFDLKVKSLGGKINGDLLLRNLEKFGTIYNTLNKVCTINGSIEIIE